MWHWRRKEKISWTDRVKNVEVYIIKKERKKIPHTVKQWKVSWNGHVVRRNCLLKYVIKRNIKGKKEGVGRRGRRCKQILDNLKEKKIV